MSQKRNLPSWMSSRDPETGPSKSLSKKPKDEGGDEDAKLINPIKDEKNRNAPSNNPSSTDFSKLMVGVSISCHVSLLFACMIELEILKLCRKELFLCCRALLILRGVR